MFSINSAGEMGTREGPGERREDASKALSNGTSGVVICICRSWWLVEMDCILWLEERLKKGMLEKFRDSLLPLARDISPAPRVGRKGQKALVILIIIFWEN